MRIPADELRRRVQVLRNDLEMYRNQLEAVPFDIPTGDGFPPACLDGGGRKFTLQLVEATLVKRFFEIASQTAWREILRRLAASAGVMTLRVSILGVMATDSSIGWLYLHAIRLS